MSLAAVILAAGKGTRMKSKLPKVLHKLCGRPMIKYVLDAASAAGVGEIIVVVGYGADLVASEIKGTARTALQNEQMGTAHALMQAGAFLRGFAGQILVLCGDTPLIEASTLTELVNSHRSSGAGVTVLTACMDNPTGYGRIIRDQLGRVAKIVEQKDASPEEKQVREVNTGIYCFEAAGLFDALDQIKPVNVQGEYYLTDVIEMYVRSGRGAAAFVVEDPVEVTGINDRIQLAGAERGLRLKILEDLMRSGVTLIDPLSTFVDRTAVVRRDTVIYPFSFIEGNTVIGEECIIGPGSRIVDSRVGNNVTILNSIVMESVIGDRSFIGPYAFLRPETKVGIDVKIGDFVEIKKSVIGNGSKVPHLSYVGDANIGEKVNIGAGTITCNYDGRKKSPTSIGDGAFIGSNTNLVAPLEIGAGAVTGAGSTITKDIPPGALGVERAKQIIIPGWTSKKKEKES